MLREGWDECQFGEITDVASGQVDPKRSPYSTMRHIGPEDIESNTGRIVGGDKTCAELGLISGKYEFNESAVIYSKIRPHLNKVCRPTFRGVCSADAYPIWSHEARLSADYLAQYMLGPIFVKAAVACSMRTGMPKINREDLQRINIRFPPLGEQQEIVRILGVWDEAILTTERLLANSYKQKQALARHLLMLDAPPDGWRRYRLGELLSERNEAGRDDLPLLSITRDEGVILREDVGRKDTSNEDKSKYLRICKGDIGYNTMRMWQGVSAVSSMEGIVSPAYTVLVPTEKIDARYAAHLFKITNMVFMFYRHSQGMVSDTWSLKYKHFSKILVTIPSRSEQERIVQVLSTADEMASVLGKTLERLRREKSGLMQQLLTGKRRVRLPQPAEVEFA